MSIPSSQKQWVVTGPGKGLDTLQYGDGEVPKVGENDVLVKFHAASLNYRDLIIPRGQYPFATQFPVVAASDGAGEVVEVGSKVSLWKKGDRVVTLFNQYAFSGLLNLITGLSHDQGSYYTFISIAEF
ncbi:hypothetical protein NPX13_g8884 [Xylaria arbuscula]|uniref:Alcohol dehydrogenase-like N-terminal domain-containing protein n=1 Tax=Xylaria arbuscula TaxID=114810 RepID=A0A9W8TJ15_9PEZI|nr:hypothetical protein NPX13_g8884 [Xylaria arbuscula]